MRARLFLASLAVVSVVIVIAGAFAYSELRAFIEARVEAELLDKLHAARVTAQMAAAAPNDVLADELGAAFGARVTFIDDDGVVRGDSEVEPSALVAVENHRTRPEVERALAGGVGRNRRTSATVHKDSLYLAERYTRGDGHGVVRVASDYEDVDAAAARLRMLLAMAGGLGLLAAIAMSALASTMLSRTLRSIVRRARELAGVVADDDEMSGLAGTMQKLAGNLEKTVATLASERNRSAAVLEAMNDGVIGIDATGAISLVNAAARESLRIQGDAIGRSLIEIARVPALEEAARSARMGTVASLEIEVHAPTLRTLLVRAAPVHAGAVIVLHDVSELRRLERVRRDFVANVSHELRTPVSVIRANAETLLHAGVDDTARARAFLEAIERNAERLTRLVSDLLDLSRIEAGQVQLDKDELPLREICLRAVEGIAKRDTHDIVVEIADGVRAVGDERAVDQVLTNLLDNAVKYGGAAGRITLRARVAADHVRVEVEDEGPGIEPKQRLRIFERFYRVDKGRSRDVGGTGLGLSIVKHLVEGMGGTVGAEPGATKGTRFFFTLPPVTVAGRAAS